MENLKERLTQAIMDYGNSDDAMNFDAEDMADYLMEVIDELRESDNTIDHDQKAAPRNPQVDEIWASTK